MDGHSHCKCRSFVFLSFALIFLLQVSLYTFVSPLGSSMMAPGLPEVATIYGITNPTVVGLTLSIFLVSFAIGVRATIALFSTSLIL
jgi:hypothetical protein